MADEAQLDRSPDGPPRLGAFLRSSGERILREWVDRARALPDAQTLPHGVLRDHMPHILEALACALEPGEHAGCAKKKRAPDIHALARLEVGFDLREVMAEYAMLRRCVLELWAEEIGDLAPIRDVLAFDRAIDEAALAAVAKYTAARERTLRALDAMSNAALSSQGIQNFLHSFFVALRETSPIVDSAAIYVVEGEDLVVRAALGPAQEASLGTRVSRGQCLAGRAVLAAAPIDSVDTRVDSRVSAAIDKGKVRSAYAVPLEIGGRVAAVIVIGAATARALSDEDRLIVRALAARAAAILALKQSHDETRAALAVLSTFMESSPLGLAFLDCDLRVVRVNTAMAEIQRRRIEEYPGQPFREFVPPPIAPETEKILRQVLATGKPLLGREVFVEWPPGSSQRAGFSSYFPVRGPDDTILGLGIVVQDITDKKAAEQALRQSQAALLESEQRLRIVVDSLPYLINFVGADERYRLNNKAYEVWFGVPPAELRGKRVVEVIGEENYRWVKPLIDRALRGETVERELPFVFRGGRRGFVHLVFVPQLSADGRVLGYVSLATDISERKRRESEDRSRLEFEQQLIGIVSHDLRNPLTAITLAATVLLRREDLDARATKTAARILASAERAVRLIHDLLDFTAARLGRGIPIAPREADFHAVVAGVLDEVHVAFPERAFRAEHVGDGRGVFDTDRVAQVVTNITSNAVQYGTAGTPVTVRTEGTATELALSVHNRGPAIPDAIRPNLFAPMQRGDVPGDPRSRSVGLGLYIVKAIVEAHGGRIEVRSTEEEGTTFVVWIPRQAKVTKEPGLPG
ncbi:PAS domain-containing protein [Polyangium sp. 15x6]|uniref:sensor histidine kinase n=1 Tax=Polyangium sp. 15x6 TaxID=3042687 RepID=UPI002499BB0C|nr:PAS domain-containing protein [Polyangium sp. 15x6]MDI3285311.1 PAS domain-containing protein [Polyangium sp. 15x6]